MNVIVDYRMGNLGSIQNMLRKIGVEATLTSDPELIANAKILLLPGVGHFDRAMQNIREMNLQPALNEAVMKRKIPTLGICLGMQIMTEKSEEGQTPGLGWIEGEVKKFHFDPSLKLPIPHMGWNNVKPEGTGHLFEGLTEEEARFYFVHSYYVTLKNRAEIQGETEYGVPLVSSFKKENMQGVQFHPEKSHRYGMTLLKNFFKGAGA